MKTLILIRHAKSSWKDFSLNDFDRPLNKRGERDAPFMGKVLLNSNDIPNLIVSSPAKRAITTAGMIAEELSIPFSEISQNKRIYGAAFQNLLELIYETSDSINCVAFVGHNPGLTILSNYLTDYYIDNIPTTGIVTIQFEIESWKEIIKGLGTMESFRYPKKYQNS